MGECDAQCPDGSSKIVSCKNKCMDEHSAKEEIIKQLFNENTVKEITKAGKECHDKCPDAAADESSPDAEAGESKESCMGTCMNKTRASILASNPMLQEIMKAGK